MLKAIAVDDEPPALEIIESYCQRSENVELLKTFTGTAKALEYLENFPVDLIFLDINMPKMNGFDFLEEYKKLPEAVKKKCIIVMLSSSLLPEDRELAMNNPYVCQFLNKPLTGDKLKDVVNP